MTHCEHRRGEVAYADPLPGSDIHGLAVVLTRSHLDECRDSVVDVHVVEDLLAVAVHCWWFRTSEPLEVGHDHRLVTGARELPRPVDEEEARDRPR